MKFQIVNIKLQKTKIMKQRLERNPMSLALRSCKGFTLIELVIVIGVLSILAIFALVAINPFEQFQKARDAQRKSDLTQLQRALEQYYQDHGSYPISSVATYTITDFNHNLLTWGSSSWNPYINLLPVDPDTTRTYVYYAAGSAPQKYQLYASLERGPSDPETCMAMVVNCIKNPTSVQYCTCSGAIGFSVDCGLNGKHYPCNFGVSSPNTTP